MEKINLGKKPISKFKKFILYILWALHDPNDRKTWDEVKHGAIKHDCKFEGDTFSQYGYKFRKCLHYGCNTVDPLD